jgi:hypothetical protein
MQKRSKPSENLKTTDMKKLFILTAIIAGSLIATKGYSQRYVGARFGHVGVARVGVGFPVYHRPYFRGPVGPAFYGGAYIAPAPVYAPAPYYAPAPFYGPAPYRPFYLRAHPYFRGGYRGRR